MIPRQGGGGEAPGDDASMAILDEILATIAADEPVREIRTCVFWTAVVSRRCGLASTGREDHLHKGPPVRNAGALARESALHLAQLSRSESLREAAIGVAAVNSLLEVDASGCRDVNASQIITEKGRDKKVVIVGSFPFISSVRETAREVVVLERMPWPDTLPEDEAENQVPDADVVAISGSTLINHSIDRLLAICPPSAFVIVLGPSTPLTPVLFDHGVDVLSGTLITDVAVALRCISEGAIFSQVRGARRVSMIRDRTMG